MIKDDIDKFRWDSGNAAELKTFLQGPTGIKLLRGLALEEPELLRKGEANEILIRSGEVAHHKHFISFLLELTGADFEHQDEDPTPNAYPSLLDDEAWEGDKLKDSEQPQQ